MKKVLICYHSSQYGGVEKHILDIITGLSKEFEIYVACPEGPLVEDYLEAGAKKHFDLFPKFEADFGYSLKIKGLIQKEKIDVVHAHELLTGSLATFGGFLAGCKKRIYHVHTSFTQWQHPGFKKYPALIVNTIANFIVGNFFATDVIALTESVKKIRINRECIFASKISVIPNGIYLDQFNYDESARKEIRAKNNITDEFVIGNIARFSAEKGHRTLIEAFKKLIEGQPDKKYILMLAGTGVLQEEIQQKVNEYNLTDKVKFLGSFNEQDKNRILSTFDCFVFPSLAEGFGIALVEAMATGIPSISSNLHVLQDVAGDASIYFKKDSAEDLKSKILELSFNEPVIKRLISDGKHRAKEFSMENFWHNYSSLFNSK